MDLIKAKKIIFQALEKFKNQEEYTSINIVIDKNFEISEYKSDDDIIDIVEFFEKTNEYIREYTERLKLFNFLGIDLMVVNVIQELLKKGIKFQFYCTCYQNRMKCSWYVIDNGACIDCPYTA